MLGALLLLMPTLDAVAQQGREEVIIQFDGPPGQLRQLIESLGGEVTEEYVHLNALVADLSYDSIEEVESAAGVRSVSRNNPILAPELVWPFGGRDVEQAAGPDPLANIASNGSTPITDVSAYALENAISYTINHDEDHVQELHALGWTGDGVIVAVVDSWLRPGFDHFDLGATVIECENFVVDGNDCIDSSNDGHGTMVAGAIASAAEFHFASSSVFLQSVAINTSNDAYPFGAVLARMDHQFENWVVFGYERRFVVSSESESRRGEEIGRFLVREVNTFGATTA